MRDGDLLINNGTGQWTNPAENICICRVCHFSWCQLSYHDLGNLKFPGFMQVTLIVNKISCLFNNGFCFSEETPKEVQCQCDVEGLKGQCPSLAQPTCSALHCQFLGWSTVFTGLPWQPWLSQAENQPRCRHSVSTFHKPSVPFTIILAGTDWTNGNCLWNVGNPAYHMCQLFKVLLWEMSD